MKKAIVFALVATVSVAVQAATISWKSGTLTASDGVQANNSNNIINGFVFLVDKDTWDAFDVATGVSEYINADGTAAKTASGTGTSSKKGAVDISTTVADTTGANYYALVFYVDKDNKVKATKGNDAINAMGSAAGDNSSGLASNSYASSTWVAVPEPTTLALLALGLAAVGLKRKVA